MAVEAGDTSLDGSKMVLEGRGRGCGARARARAPAGQGGDARVAADEPIIF